MVYDSWLGTGTKMLKLNNGINDFIFLITKLASQKKNLQVDF
jgi:hypothetical protein